MKVDLDNEGVLVRTVFVCYMRWAGYVARVGERRDAYRVLVGKPVGRDHLEDPGVGGRIILKLIFRK